jgi:hypothetical protein
MDEEKSKLYDDSIEEVSEELKAKSAAYFVHLKEFYVKKYLSPKTALPFLSIHI